MNQKGFTNILLVVVIVVIVAIGGYFVLSKKSEPIAKQPTPTPVQINTPVSPTPTSSNPTPQPNTETPVVEKDVANQPAYLIATYLKNGKNYIDVDYVEWLHGKPSIKARVEDKKCTIASECYDYPNGYKRNQNPKVRTFEVFSLASIKVNGEIAAKINEIDQTHLENPYGRNLEISFKKLVDIVSKIKSYLPYNSPFKEPKTFIAIDIKDNIVTKIIEPYQE